ncbi:MAG: DUF3617 domain-containing protein [Acidobacteriota bacterium]|nr:DUF3617 domain-containing protein [Acidobacteriota bacterium]
MIRVSAILFSVAAAFLLTTAAGAAQPPVLEPGLWEVTIKTQMGDATPTMIEQICISKEQADRPEPPKAKKAADCQVTGALTGNKSKYQIKCGRKNATSDVEFTYSGDRYEGVVTIKNDDVGELRQVYTAKRIGACPSESED